MTFKSGFVGLIGRPNAGKSTLLNALVNQKVAIMTDTPQTTRNIIRAVRTDDDSQIIFVDTPGVHKPKHKLGQTMVSNALSTINAVDIVYLIVDASKPYGKGDEFLLNIIKKSALPVFLILNKIDLLSKSELIELIVAWQERADFKEIIPISALRVNNLETLINVTKNYLTDDVQYYPTEQVSDYPEKFIISEIIREKIINATKEEIPHSIAVVIENISKKRETLSIRALVLVERDSQKGIIIGKNGSMLKHIGQQAREELELRLNEKIYLELFVKVEKDWRNRLNKLQQFGILEANTDGDY